MLALAQLGHEALFVLSVPATPLNVSCAGHLLRLVSQPTKHTSASHTQRLSGLQLIAREATWLAELEIACTGSKLSPPVTLAPQRTLRNLQIVQSTAVMTPRLEGARSARIRNMLMLGAIAHPDRRSGGRPAATFEPSGRCTSRACAFAMFRAPIG